MTLYLTVRVDGVAAVGVISAAVNPTFALPLYALVDPSASVNVIIVSLKLLKD